MNSIYMAPPCEWILHMLQSTEDPVILLDFFHGFDADFPSISCPFQLLLEYSCFHDTMPAGTSMCGMPG